MVDCRFESVDGGMAVSARRFVYLDASSRFSTDFFGKKDVVEADVSRSLHDDDIGGAAVVE